MEGGKAPVHPSGAPLVQLLEGLRVLGAHLLQLGRVLRQSEARTGVQVHRHATCRRQGRVSVWTCQPGKQSRRQARPGAASDALCSNMSACSAASSAGLSHVTSGVDSRKSCCARRSSAHSGASTGGDDMVRTGSLQAAHAPGGPSTQRSAPSVLAGRESLAEAPLLRASNRPSRRTARS